jgi:hypothetical protein
VYRIVYNTLTEMTPDFGSNWGGVLLHANAAVYGRFA